MHGLFPELWSYEENQVRCIIASLLVGFFHSFGVSEDHDFLTDHFPENGSPNIDISWSFLDLFQRMHDFFLVLGLGNSPCLAKPAIPQQTPALPRSASTGFGFGFSANFKARRSDAWLTTLIRVSLMLAFPRLRLYKKQWDQWRGGNSYQTVTLNWKWEVNELPQM